MTPDENYFLYNTENLSQKVQMKLSEKLNIFCKFSTAFPKFIFNLEHFEKKDDSHALCLSESVNCEIFVYVNV